MHYDPTEALERIDNDTGLLIMLIEVFVKECPSYIGKLQTARDRQDLNALGDAAHNIKGARGGLQAIRGKKYCVLREQHRKTDYRIERLRSNLERLGKKKPRLSAVRNGPLSVF